MAGEACIPERCENQTERFFCMAMKGSGGELTFKHGKTPEAAEHGFSAPAHENPVAGTNEEDSIGDCFLRPGFRQDRKIGRIALAEGIAEGRKGTTTAVRRTGNADGGTEIHEGLIMVSGAVRGNKVRSKLLNALPG